MKSWQEAGFEVELTEDGSPTLRVLGDGESMHHSGGALAETLLIYGQPLRELFVHLETPKVLSLGLGLGYVELVTAAWAIRAGKKFEILSLESVDALVEVFMLWVQDQLEEGEPKATLDDLGARISTVLEVPLPKLKAALCLARQENRWTLGGALRAEAPPQGRFHGLLYDVFSAKTNPDLWTQEFLETFLDRCAEPDALLTTFACTGNLKRALKNKNFGVIRRDGFKGKRNSTLGLRGKFNSSAEASRD